MSLEKSLVGHSRLGVLLELLLGGAQPIEDIGFELRRGLHRQRLVVSRHGPVELLGRKQALGLVVQRRQHKLTLGIPLGHPPVLDRSRLEIRHLSRSHCDVVHRQAEVVLHPIGQLELGIELQQLPQCHGGIGVPLELQLTDGQVQTHRRQPHALGMHRQELLPAGFRIGVKPLFLEALGHDVITRRHLLGLGLLRDPGGGQQQHTHQATDQRRGLPPSALHSHTPVPQCRNAMTAEPDHGGDISTKFDSECGLMVPAPIETLNSPPNLTTAESINTAGDKFAMLTPGAVATW